MTRHLLARRLPRGNPAGYAFSIPELETARGWAARRGIRLDIRLDHLCPGADFEEVLAFSPRRGRAAWVLWRGPEHLIAERADGTRRRFVCLADALEAIGR
ncbi:MAG: hypothetical protein KGI51_07485 [Rhodospirillales bacterium]|nr:hypothetical protein [Rhodospirillales bacterium]